MEDSTGLDSARGGRTCRGRTRIEGKEGRARRIGQGAHQSSNKRVFFLLFLFDFSLRLHSALRPSGVEVYRVLEDGQDLRGEQSDEWSGCGEGIG
jgi:hypothetical protein